jgi:hypothetical protein
MQVAAKSDPHARLLRAVLALAGQGSEITSSSSRRWSSATFTGARHGVTLQLAGANARDRAHRLAESLPDAEFPLAGHIVADISVESQAYRRGEDGEGVAQLDLAVLTVEDW